METELQITNTQITNNSAKRIASVIQAFGGKGRLDHPRLPTWQEMDCLAFLSVVHGSRGVFFYTFNWIGKTREGRERLGRVIGRLNQIYPWLVVENSGETVQVEMLSENRFDPKGKPAVQCCVKRKGKDWMVIAVNTIGTGVETEVSAPQLNTPRGTPVQRGREGRAQSAEREELGAKQYEKVNEVFSGEDYAIVDGKVRVRFGPYETKAFLFRGGN